MKTEGSDNYIGFSERRSQQMERDRFKLEIKKRRAEARKKKSVFVETEERMDELVSREVFVEENLKDKKEESRNAELESFLEADDRKLAEKELEEMQIKFPEAFDFNLEAWQRRRERLVTREEFVDTIDLRLFLEMYGFGNLDFRETESGNIEIKVKTRFHSEKLPVGYGYKGGAARALLLRALEIEKDVVPRDIDIVRISKIKPRTDLDEVLAKKFANEDLEDGFGVEEIKDIDEYFSKRDLTINEVLADEKVIICTPRCLKDTIRRIIRITDFERARFYKMEKILAKTIRLFSQGIAERSEMEIGEAEKETLEANFISPFWLCVNLDRAAESGPEALRVFILNLKARKLVHSDIETIKDLAEYLAAGTREGHFYFRNLRFDQENLESEVIDNKDSQLVDENERPKFIPFSRSRKN